ncbi:lipin Ned1 [Coemansia sp. RSA 353]|nr:lipin Ned1 [Coemansia sp. RSA 562]KAJ2190079.1 lipin Ned1 [Coemansia sp. RSA 532]KAJ2200397.1 lipin Ned1 [Coemansia sp. RSA 522]KAJ2208563.1 lipin Ned1 [Coemansia sp. RSA 521]KAJ2291494.1 lipin Ned1 [Coemansia sp. RSA 355]KAJ2300662.1 lipin Ned1 [Coemansia sp. RSA 353]
MQYVGKVFSTVSQLYKELNPATLSGAIDVVVVEDANGELRCSPFHVRFGKLQLLRPSDKAVQIIINDSPADFYMKVGDSGEGFFVLETEADVPSQFATSPVASPALSFKGSGEEPDFLDLGGAVGGDAQDGYVSAPSAHESDAESPLGCAPEVASRLPFIDDMAIATPRREPVLHQLNAHSTRPHEPEVEFNMRGHRHRHSMSALSDSELVLNLARDAEPRPSQKSDDSELHTDWDWGVKIASPKSSAAIESPARGPEPTRFDVAAVVNDGLSIAMSRCGIDAVRDADCADTQQSAFDMSLIQPDEYSASVMADPNLTFRVGDSAYVQRDVFLQSLVSQLAFGRSGDIDTQGVVPVLAESLKEERLVTPLPDAGTQTPIQTPKPERRWWRWGQRTVSAAGDLAGEPVQTATSLQDTAAVEPTNQVATTLQDTVESSDQVAIDMGYMSDDGQLAHPMKPNVHYAKTLRLTSAQLQSLNLRRGANDVKFLVPSNNAYCEARIFLYRHDTQIVISDIDGTITKSDALGHLFNMVGKDWTHHGVAKLYTDIVSNGYEILYLTSRAIGQADGTRYFISNVKQGEYKLPLGPLLLSPDRLFTSFHREVIKRRPHEFKMACLRDIKNLFGDYSSFYAGFGNRITDAMSYRSVNVPVSRICTIDSSGEIKLDLLPGYKSSYVGMNDLVDMMFPALSSKLDQKYNDWKYWRSSLPKIDAELDALDAELALVSDAKAATQKKRQENGVSPIVSDAPLFMGRESRAMSSATAPGPSDLRPSPKTLALMSSSPDLLARQRADSWSTSAAPGSTPEPAPTNTASSGRMSILKKATAFSPFSLVRAGASSSVQSRPAPKFEYSNINTVDLAATQAFDAVDQLSPASASASPRSEPSQSLPKSFDLGQMDKPDIAEPTDDVDEEPIEDPDVAAAASRLVPQVDVLRRSDSGRPGASIRVNSTASFLSQYSEEYEDEDDEDIDQETLAIMHDMEEVQRL